MLSMWFFKWSFRVTIFELILWNSDKFEMRHFRSLYHNSDYIDFLDRLGFKSEIPWNHIRFHIIISTHYRHKLIMTTYIKRSYLNINKDYIHCWSGWLVIWSQSIGDLIEWWTDCNRYRYPMLVISDTKISSSI